MKTMYWAQIAHCVKSQQGDSLSLDTMVESFMNRFKFSALPCKCWRSEQTTRRGWEFCLWNIGQPKSPGILWEKPGKAKSKKLIIFLWNYTINNPAHHEQMAVTLTRFSTKTVKPKPYLKNTVDCRTSYHVCCERRNLSRCVTFSILKVEGKP